MRALLILLLSCSAIFSYAQASNILPMYGSAPKTKEQLKADKTFMKGAVKQFGSHQEAAIYHAKRGWDYLYNDDPYTAMKRFNQAWMLDSSNAAAFWGFATVTATHVSLEGSLQYFEKALSLDKDNYNLYNDAATAYIMLFEENGGIRNLEKAIRLLRIALPLKPENPKSYANLTHAYSYYPIKDSAIRYMHLTDAIDSVFITQDIRDRVKK